MRTLFWCISKRLKLVSLGKSLKASIAVFSLSCSDRRVAMPALFSLYLAMQDFVPSLKGISVFKVNAVIVARFNKRALIKIFFMTT
ncbi:hypothetical protein D3C85_1282480 [compost metagenome]